MYRSCIFCASPLGTNRTIEAFPVGRQVAFDAFKGRLWAVCPRCARWNLAPIEERWEPVEAAEKMFRDARLRVQSENVGLAQLPDGTRLVRIGKALDGEMAAWRYGTQLVQRRRRWIVGGAAGLAGWLALYGGGMALGGGLFGFIIAASWWDERSKQRVVHRLPSAPDGAAVVVRRWHIAGISVAPAAASGSIEVQIRDAHRTKPGGLSYEVNPKSSDIVAVHGDDARRLLARAMVHVNARGASPAELESANRRLIDAGSAERMLREAAAGGAALGNRAGHSPAVLAGPDALAFEMALNEVAERRALEGELAALTESWRAAEEIAAIADALPGEAAVNRLLDRLAR